MNEMQKSFIQNGPSFLIHYNHNHDPKTGRFSSSTLFVSGSSKTQSKDSGYYRKKLPKQVRKELDIAMDMKDRIVVGDAPGVDRQVQDYLKNKKYKNVEIFGPGKQVRYSADPEWKTNAIDSKHQEGSKEWLAEKDKVMSEMADRGLAVILDEGSKATRDNITRLLDKHKDVSVYELSKEGKRKDSKVEYVEDLYNSKERNPLKKEIINPRKTTFTNEYGNKLAGEYTHELVNSKFYKKMESDTRKYATDRLYMHYSMYPEFYNLPKKLNRKEFAKHVDLDQVSVPAPDGVNGTSWVMYFSDTGSKPNEYPDNTWMVVYDEKDRKIDERNSQYYR